jgi:Leucine-rich repeat (LRR) protein
LPSLKFLALQNNLIETLGTSLAYLHDLEFLDLGHNRIETLNIEDSLPPSIMFLKLRGNPIAAQLMKYRQPFVE